jgi:hypothetical protein
MSMRFYTDYAGWVYFLVCAIRSLPALGDSGREMIGYPA